MIATAIVFVAFVTSIVVANQLWVYFRINGWGRQKLKQLPRITILIGAVGALVTLIAIAIDIAFNILTRHAVDKITDLASTSFGPGKYKFLCFELGSFIFNLTFKSPRFLPDPGRIRRHPCRRSSCVHT